MTSTTFLSETPIERELTDSTEEVIRSYNAIFHPQRNNPMKMTDQEFVEFTQHLHLLQHYLYQILNR